MRANPGPHRIEADQGRRPVAATPGEASGPTLAPHPGPNSGDAAARSLTIEQGQGRCRSDTPKEENRNEDANDPGDDGTPD